VSIEQIASTEKRVFDQPPNEKQILAQLPDASKSRVTPEEVKEYLEHLAHYPIARDERRNMLAILNAPDVRTAIAEFDPSIMGTVNALLSDYLLRRPTLLKYDSDPGVGEWLADGSRWVPTDNMEGFGPHLSGVVPVLALTTDQMNALDKTRSYLIPILIEGTD
jgi:hypothetical protein